MTGVDGECKNDEARAEGCVKLSGWSAEGRRCCGNAKLRGWEKSGWYWGELATCVHFRRGGEREMILPALLHAFRPSDIGGSATLLAALGSSAASQLLLQALSCNPIAHFQLGPVAPSKLPASYLQHCSSLYMPGYHQYRTW